jgi:hypothetical protein
VFVVENNDVPETDAAGMTIAAIVKVDIVSEYEFDAALY